MDPLQAHQLAVKFYVDGSMESSLGVFVPIFHNWIQEDRLEHELMVDVADYSHVYRGPGVVLVCHDAHYSLDQRDGRLGLLYSRRRKADDGEVESRLHAVFRSALTACALLENEPSLKGQLRFRPNEILLQIHNRLLAPNTTATFRSVRERLEQFFHALYPEVDSINYEHIPGAKEPFGVQVRMPGAPSLATLLCRMGGAIEGTSP